MGASLTRCCERPLQQFTSLPTDPALSQPEVSSLGPIAPRTYQNGRYTQLGKIGSGGFSKVYLVKDHQTNQEVAIKVIKKSLLKSRDAALTVDQVLAERKILIEVNSPFVVRFTQSFQDDHNLYFVMEYCRGGSLSKYLVQRKHFHESLARFYLCEIVMGLKVLHEDYQIIYKDLKTENILLTDQGHIKIADFGLSVIGEKVSDIGAGTAEYIAPEVISHLPHTNMVDYWSLGCVAYVMLFGKFPFYNRNRRVQFAMITSGMFNFPETPRVSGEAKSFISSLLVINPTHRLGSKGAREVMAHPFFRGVDWEVVEKRTQRPPLVTSQAEVKRESHDPESMPTDYKVQGFTYEANFSPPTRGAFR